MSQTEIDTILSLEPEEEAAPAEASPTDAEVEAAPMAEAKAAPTENESVESMVSDLAQRVAKIEAAMGRLEELQKTVKDATAILRKQPRDFQSVVNELQEVSAQVEEISEKLRSTPVYDIGESFQCNVCGSHGLVAIRVKCTGCEQENWWGWWSEE